jgi:hypothetical protein
MDGDARRIAGRDDYYDVAFYYIVLCCDACRTFLDPDKDLGPGLGSHSPDYEVLLGNEAFRRGWLVEILDPEKLTVRCLCPVCRRKRGGVVEKRPPG